MVHDWQYNWVHIVFVTKKRKRNFRKEYNRTVAKDAIEEEIECAGATETQSIYILPILYYNIS